MSAVFFLSTILGTYIAINLYMLLRLGSTLAGTGLLRGVSCAVLAFLACSVPLGRVFYDKPPHQLSEFLLLVGSLYCAPMIYGFIFTLLADLLRIANKFVSITPLPPPFTVSGRVHTVCAVALLALLVSLLGALNARYPVVVRQEIPWEAPAGAEHMAGQSDVLKIALVSDIHLGMLVGPSHLASVMKLVEAEKPDILLLAGDILDDIDWLRNDEKRERAAALFSGVSPRLGSWAVTGNHEFYAGEQECVDFLTGAGVRVLRDEWAAPGDELLLAGREDRTVLRMGGTRKSLDEIVGEISAAAPDDLRNLPLIVMDHQPFDLYESENVGAALQVSGHTHRGQLFPFNFVVSRIYEKSYGIYKKGKTYYYISSGAGTWGPPVRTTGRPEVVIITLNKKR